MTQYQDHNSAPPPAYANGPAVKVTEKGDKNRPQQQLPLYTPQPIPANRPVEYTPLLNNTPGSYQTPGQDNYRYVIREQTGARRIRRQGCCSRFCGRLCMFILASIAVFSILFGAVMMSARHDPPHGHDHDHEPDHHGDGLHRELKCQRHRPFEDTFNVRVPLSAGPNVSIEQDLWRNRHHSNVRASFEGVVYVLPAPSSLDDDFFVDVDIRSTSRDIVKGVSVQSHRSSFYLDFDSAPIEALREDHCTEIIIRLYVRDSLKQIPDALSINTSVLDIEVESNSALQVNKLLQLHSTVGVISASPSAKISARRIQLETNAGGIIGTWPLADLLAAHATSGSISIQYSPQHSLESHPYEPAVLDLSSNAGSVHAIPALASQHFEWPARRYATKLSTTAGIIRDARIPLGESVSGTTAAGSLAVEILPVAFPRLTQDGRKQDHTADDNAPLSTITTKSGSGSTRVRLSAPRADDGELIKVLTNTVSSHQSASGNLNLHYPQAWAGHIKLDSTTGSVRVQGDGVEIINDKKGWVGHSIEAVKKTSDGHDGSSRIEASVVAGSLRLTVQDGE